MKTLVWIVIIVIACNIAYKGYRLYSRTKNVTDKVKGIFK